MSNDVCHFEKFLTLEFIEDCIFPLINIMVFMSAALLNKPLRRSVFHGFLKGETEK